ncbi:RTA1-domain-containing protein [Dichomitus squalens]|uniref:RTA1-domain-containing protein n=1 Tax=Dichomitus squalens TaxID=114155 RepID=A0A4Q9N3X3_9APHY|nr:RTA1-domain-containing protein [Dichomitus squalens]
MSSNLGNDADPEYDSHGNLISPFYGYMPTQWVCYIFAVLFTLSTLLHFGQAIRYRAWWLLATVVLAGVGEMIGWGGRLWSTFQPLAENPYMIQIVCTIVAPTPLIGAIFISFGRLSTHLGPQYSRLSARLYSRIFFTADFVALLVQSAGGGIAATADDSKTGQLGSNIMLAGIVFQLVSLSIFCILAIEYFIRYFKENPARPLLLNNISNESVVEHFNHPPMDPAAKLLVVGLFSQSLFLFIRSIYRTIELSDGFHGRIIRTEVYFNVLDGAMVVLAMFSLNFFHPARLLKKLDERFTAGSTVCMTSKNIYSQESV